jgi:uncharacterized YigZ family protein
MPVSRYPVPAGIHRVETVIQRSRFITTLGPAPTVEAARTFIAAIRRELADATHHCWAYLVGPPGHTAQVGFSDDGEPHGTAGRPMLDVLVHSGVGDIVAVVTRYFGGVLLGKGGLVRAYSGGVKLALADLPRAERVERKSMTLILPYTFLKPLRLLLPDFAAEVVAEDYAADVTLHLQVPVDRLDELGKAVEALTQGRAVMAVLPPERL